uniref:Uncharacterized protein n=1 Tax=Leersia perrieri TaxID=77586 RepID=A0A0D9UXE9_9ORYZ
MAARLTGGETTAAIACRAFLLDLSPPPPLVSGFGGGKKRMERGRDTPADGDHIQVWKKYRMEHRHFTPENRTAKTNSMTKMKEIELFI